ncbi:hypothetical protein HNP73_002232 [Amaricoccus macauensis]|uniref:DUF4167 domain-containing protein n=1 Tax=Amaricoccus macauensis TaxID=57001 RepID=A0A840SR15_9RHOB|nr:DUF4167 domain-containing protein [Amaricoccus macauensis]MBB5222296.1 hypothetical protein [Amaricoccus macauensis]
MRPSNKSRSRNKTGNSGSHSNNNNNQRRNSMGNIINRVFESAGPDGKVRGTPQQIIDKYQALARDAQVSGDRVAAESYLQHSEHYGRLLGEAQRVQQEARASQERDGDREEGGFDQRRQQSQPNVGSGLTMIDTDDGFDSGPIETPEGRRGGYEDNSGFQRRDREPREQRVNGQSAPHAAGPAPQAHAAQAAPAPQVPAAQAAPAQAPAAQAAPAPQAEPVQQATPAPQDAAAPQAEPVTQAEPAPLPEPVQQTAPEPVAEPQPAARVRSPRTRREAAPAAVEPVAAPDAAVSGAATQEEAIELAEPEAEPAKKPRARRRKTQPAVTATDEAAAAPEPAAAPEAAPSE